MRTILWIAGTNRKRVFFIDRDFGRKRIFYLKIISGLLNKFCELVFTEKEFIRLLATLEKFQESEKGRIRVNNIESIVKFLRNQGVIFYSFDVYDYINSAKYAKEVSDSYKDTFELIKKEIGFLEFLSIELFLDGSSPSQLDYLGSESYVYVETGNYVRTRIVLGVNVIFNFELDRSEMILIQLQKFLDFSDVLLREKNLVLPPELDYRKLTHWYVGPLCLRWYQSHSSLANQLEGKHDDLSKVTWQKLRISEIFTQTKKKTNSDEYVLFAFIRQRVLHRR